MAEKESKNNFWSSMRIILVFVFLIGLVAGLVLHHYVTGPLISGFFSESIAEELAECRVERSELLTALNKCHDLIEES